MIIIMNDQPLFRWIFIAIFVIALVISGYFRRKARQSGEVIPRAREGRLIVAGRILFAAPLYLSVFAYMLNPNWMGWSRLNLPTGLRWLAAMVGLATLPFIYWVFRSIGHNVSETFLTKEQSCLGDAWPVSLGPPSAVLLGHDRLCLVEPGGGELVHLDDGAAGHSRDRLGGDTERGSSAHPEVWSGVS